MYVFILKQNCFNMSEFKWWHILFDIKFISLVLLVIAIIYCIWAGYGKTKKGFNLQLQDLTSKKKKRKRRVNKHEERCREIFQEIFHRRFKSVRPKWLKNPATGKNLELDGYSSHIRTPIGKGLAFEYDGIQHSKYTKHFHGSNPKAFLYQTKKDEWKDLLCKKRGVKLIRIPHFVAYEDLERFIKNKLRRENILRN